MKFQLKDPSLFKSLCLVNGAWCGADDGSVLEVDNPATGAVIGTVPRMGTNDVRKAIDAAADAWPKWKELTPSGRAACLFRWGELINENKEDLAQIMTYEQGKPVAEALGEIALGHSYVPWYAEECRRVYGDVIPAPKKGIRPITHKQPIGPVAAITPWNFPMSMVTRKAAPALAAGCPVVLKPASATPFTALALAELAQRAGFPAGVFNVVTGNATVVGNEISSNPKIRKISFTGSTAVGKKLMADSAATMKGLSLELGGNAPFLVFDDADLETVLAGCMGSKFRNAGQACISTNRALIQKGISAKFIEQIVERVRGLKIGNGFDDGVQIGPLINKAAVEFVDGIVQDALAKGAQLLTGGKRLPLGENYYEPTVLAGVTPEMRLFHEEIFGPVLPIMTFETEEEAIALANNTAFGLASYLFTRDLGRSWRVSEALEYGLVGVNDVALAMAEVPFGGVKDSGTGREGGHEGLTDFMETRYVLMGGIGA